MSVCLICECRYLKTFYRGPIRMGSFGKLSESHHEVTECQSCGARHLPPVVGDLDGYYRDGTYREDLDQGNTIRKYFELADDSQPHKLDILGMHGVRARTVVDVGCGAGSFLDLVRGIASRTIAVEPNRAYHESLRQRGHLVYPSLEATTEDWQGEIDIAVSFSVVEHVENPREFLEDIRLLLRPKGQLLVSTPNADDLLLEICPAYQRFFYRMAHLWYFTADAIRELSRVAGFRECEILFEQRFDLSNAMLWLRDSRPTGLGKIELNAHINRGWQSFLESSGRSDYLYAILKA